MIEIMYFPFMVFIIVFTAILSSIVTTSLPYMPKYWYAIKTRIKRVFTPKMEPHPHYVEQIRKIDLDLQDKIDDLKKEVNNIAERLVTREKHLKGNIRRYVREYLEELKND